MLPYTNKPSTGDYDNSKARRTQSCWRVWRRLSRLQRKVVMVILLIGGVGSIVVFRHFIPGGSEQSKRVLDNNPLGRNNEENRVGIGHGGVEDPVNDDFNPGVGGDDIGDQDKGLKGRPGKRGPPKLLGGGGKQPIRDQDTELVDPIEGNQPIGDQDTDKERVLPHLGIQVPPGVVKEGVRNKEDEIYMAENDDNDDNDEYDIDHSDVGAAAGAPGVKPKLKSIIGVHLWLSAFFYLVAEICLLNIA